MAYTEKQLLEFYRRLAREVDRLDTVYGWRFTCNSANVCLSKIKKLVREVDPPP